MGYQRSFEIVRIEDIHLAAGLMAQGFSLHACEVAADGWAKFCILVPDTRKGEMEALAGLSREGQKPEDDILVPFGAYRKALGELRGLLRQTKEEMGHGRRPERAGVATL